MPAKTKRKLSVEETVEVTTLVSVENLINLAMGPAEKNTVNFKMIQTILRLLAQQMRLLETKVEIRIADLRDKDTVVDDNTQSEDEKKRSPVLGKKERKGSPTKSKHATEEFESKTAKYEEKGQIKVEMEQAKAAKEQAKADKAVANAEKEQAKATKEQAKANKAAADAEKEQAKAAKEQAKADKAAADAEKGQAKATKEQAKSEKATANAEKEQAKATKEQAKSEKATANAEKEQAKAAKEQAKSEKATANAEKEQAKAAKEQAKSEKATANAEKEQAKAAKEQAKFGKAAADAEKEQAKSAKAQAKSTKAAAKADKEKEESEKVTRTEKEKNEKVQEKLRKKEQLIAEPQPRSRPSIEVVTRSQFALLEDAVARLTLVTAPVPMPSLPANQELLEDLSKGSATLTDTMQAMQVTARVAATEEAISRMTGMLTQLTSAGAMPGGGAATAEESLMEEFQKPKPVRKSVMLESTKEPKTGKMAGTGTRSSVAGTSLSSVANIGVTHVELDDAVQMLKLDLLKNVQMLTNKAIASADFANSTTKAIYDRLDVALGLNSRVSDLYALTSDYADQLKGFDVGITSQMQGFQEQMVQMRNDLKEGLTQLGMVNNNSETAAVTELTERFDELVHDMDTTITAHRQLESIQNQLSDELRSLVEVAELMREQKADRDEVLDGLRDKAGMSQLQGLLAESDFLRVREELNQKLEDCYTKFRKQEAVWEVAMRDLSELLDTKAGIMLLLSLKEEAQRALQNIDDKLAILFEQLGEPKAAILMRQLSKDGKCGVCNVEALMAPVEPTAGQPSSLPALHFSDLCRPPVQSSAWLTEPKEEGSHICNRWVGGSHTLLSRLTPREQAPKTTEISTHTRRYLGVGSDGRNYKMEEDIKPCAECIPCQEEVGDTKREEGQMEVKKKGSCHCNDPTPPGQDGAGDLNMPE